MLWTYCGCFIKVKRWRAALWCFHCLLHCLRGLTVTQTDLMSCGSDMNNEWKHQWGCQVMFLTDGLCSFDSNMKQDLISLWESAVSSSVTLSANCIFHCMILITFNPTFSLFAADVLRLTDEQCHGNTEHTWTSAISSHVWNLSRQKLADKSNQMNDWQMKYTVEIKWTEYEMWAAQTMTVNAEDISQRHNETNNETFCYFNHFLLHIKNWTKQWNHAVIFNVSVIAVKPWSSLWFTASSSP